MPKKPATNEDGSPPYAPLNTGTDTPWIACPDCADGYADAELGRCHACDDAATKWYTVRTR